MWLQDWWDLKTGQSWLLTNGVDFVEDYAVRARDAGLPLDNEVLYGVITTKPILIHEMEIVDESTQLAAWELEAQAQDRGPAPVPMQPAAGPASRGVAPTMIKVLIQDGGPNWLRKLVISNQDQVPLDRSPDHISDYQVELYTADTIVAAPRRIERFKHRYGDDSLTLVSKAIDALGGQEEPREGVTGTQRR